MKKYDTPNPRNALAVRWWLTCLLLAWLEGEATESESGRFCPVKKG